jgi:hypothetical protein
VTYRPRKLKQAKIPLSAAALRYFMAPWGSTDDYEAAVAECEAGSEQAQEQLFTLYYATDWKELWREHRDEIEAQWKRRFPDPEQFAKHKKWALQSYDDRLRERFRAERERIEIM